jgi:hypothetical protein
VRRLCCARTPPPDAAFATPAREQKAAVKKPVAAKSAAAVAAAAKAAGGASRDDILSDPLAEKLRQARLQEASDLEHAKAAFGEATKNVDELLPRTEAVRAGVACAIALAACFRAAGSRRPLQRACARA